MLNWKFQDEIDIRDEIDFCPKEFLVFLKDGNIQHILVYNDTNENGDIETCFCDEGEGVEDINLLADDIFAWINLENDLHYLKEKINERNKSEYSGLSL